MTVQEIVSGVQPESYAFAMILEYSLTESVCDDITTEISDILAHFHSSYVILIFTHQ